MERIPSKCIWWDGWYRIYVKMWLQYNQTTHKAGKISPAGSAFVEITLQTQLNAP